MLSGETTNTNFIVFGVTRPGLEPTTYCTWGEHGNQYVIEVVGMDVNMILAKSNRDPQRVDSTTFCNKELP